jgi:hypothetical protein
MNLNGGIVHGVPEDWEKCFWLRSSIALLEKGHLVIMDQTEGYIAIVILKVKDVLARRINLA